MEAYETLHKSQHPAVIAWLVRHQAELALTTVTITKIALGIQKHLPDQRAMRPGQWLFDGRRRFADRIAAAP